MSGLYDQNGFVAFAGGAAVVAGGIGRLIVLLAIDHLLFYLLKALKFIGDNNEIGI